MSNEPTSAKRAAEQIFRVEFKQQVGKLVLEQAAERAAWEQREKQLVEANIGLEVLVAHPLPDWANDPEYAWFADAYNYAATQSAAIPAMAKCTPNEIYSLVLTFLCDLNLLENHSDNPFEHGKPIDVVALGKRAALAPPTGDTK